MTDDFKTLADALKANPAPDPDAKAAALRLAMENFDRIQGSALGPRPTQDRPTRAGFLRGVLNMFKPLNSHPYLAATTSVLALCVGLLIVVPQLQKPGPLVAVPDSKPTNIVTEAPAEKLAKPEPNQAVIASRSDQAAATTPPATSAQPEADKLEKLATDAPNAQAPVSNFSAAQLAPLPAPAPQMRADALAAQMAPASPPRAMVATGMVMESAVPADGMIADTVTDQRLTQVPNTEAFANAALNPVHVTAEDPVSTFAAEVDTASYAVIRSSLNAGQLPAPEAVRIEEMLNYFPYAYPAPEAGAAPFQPTVSVMPTPWNPGTRLVHIALQGRMPAIADRPPLNLVFLIDTSGSMEDANKLPLLKQSLALMLPKLRPQDRVAIVTYAGSAGEVLAPTKAADRQAILRALDNLQAGGATAGAAGIALAYQVAAQMKSEGSVTRVLLATDGDFNVGIDDPDQLKTFIAKEKATGVYLSVLGFGRGNLDDSTMQALAQNGNGTASYIDTLAEAQKVLVDQLTGALFPIADDVKIQVEWNPAQIAEYRLIGYETRALKREDFNNDHVDAGEIGAGLQVTALYEVTAPGSPALLNDALRYGKAPDVTGSPELGFLRLRYKDPGQSTSKLLETPITATGEANDDARFAVAIAGFGQLLQHSTYLGNWSWDQAIAMATGARGTDDYGYRIEAVNLMRLAQSLSQ